VERRKSAPGKPFRQQFCYRFPKNAELNLFCERCDEWADAKKWPACSKAGGQEFLSIFPFVLAFRGSELNKDNSKAICCCCRLLCGGPYDREEPRLSKEVQALALLIQYPEWTDKRIAEAISVSRTTLYTWPKFRAAKAWLKSQRQAIPRGFKTTEGSLEAYADEDEDESS
jgi:hypothetical protein